MSEERLTTRRNFIAGITAGSLIGAGALVRADEQEGGGGLGMKTLVEVDGKLKSISVELEAAFYERASSGRDPNLFRAFVERQAQASVDLRRSLGISVKGVTKITYTTQKPNDGETLFTWNTALRDKLRMRPKPPIRLDDYWDCQEDEDCACSHCVLACWCQWEIYY